MENSPDLGASFVFDSDMGKEHQQKFITFVEQAGAVMLQSSPCAPNIIEAIAVFTEWDEKLLSESIDLQKMTCYTQRRR